MDRPNGYKVDPLIKGDKKDIKIMRVTIRRIIKSVPERCGTAVTEVVGCFPSSVTLENTAKHWMHA